MKVWSRASFCLAEQGGSANKSASTLRAPLTAAAVKTNYQGREERSSWPLLPPFLFMSPLREKAQDCVRGMVGSPSQDSMSWISTLLSHLPHP